jgi:hypothetical protein
VDDGSSFVRNQSVVAHEACSRPFTIPSSPDTRAERLDGDIKITYDYGYLGEEPIDDLIKRCFYEVDHGNTVLSLMEMASRRHTIQFESVHARQQQIPIKHAQRMNASNEPDADKTNKDSKDHKEEDQKDDDDQSISTIAASDAGSVRPPPRNSKIGGPPGKAPPPPPPASKGKHSSGLKGMMKGVGNIVRGLTGDSPPKDKDATAPPSKRPPPPSRK